MSNTERAEPSEADRKLAAKILGFDYPERMLKVSHKELIDLYAGKIRQHVADETAELRLRVGELEAYRDICNKVIKDDETEFDRLNSLLELAQDEAADLRKQLEEARADNVKLQKVIFGCKDHDNEFEKQIEHLRAQLELAQGDKEIKTK